MYWQEMSYYRVRRYKTINQRLREEYIDEWAEDYYDVDVEINQDDDETQLNFIKGKRFAITGKIEYGRSALTDFIEKNGGTVTSTVSKKTDILIANQPEESAKYNNAVSYGTKIMTELEFFTQLEK